MTLPRQYARLVGSKWTSTTPLRGWRQFHVVTLRRAGSSWEAELAASVEPARRTWIDLGDLRSRDRFTPGWSTLATLRAASVDGATVACGAVDGVRAAASGALGGGKGGVEDGKVERKAWD